MTGPDCEPSGKGSALTDALASKPKEIDMKKTLIGLILAAVAGTVWAGCSYNSIVVGGTVVTCSTCCDDQGGNCVTVCN